MTAASPSAHERFEDRLLAAFLEHFEDIRDDKGGPAGTLPPDGPRRHPVALASLAVLAAVGLGIALALNLGTGSAGSAPGLRWALAGYVGSSWEGTAGRGLTVSGPDHQALTCPSATTCYVEGPANARQGAEVEATYNAGKTWHLAGAGGATALSNVSCASARVCALLEGRANEQPLFVETTDGGTTWIARPAPSWLSPLVRDTTSGPASTGPAEPMTSMSCRSASSCSVLAWSGKMRDYKPSGRSLASVTMDGGLTWSSPVAAFVASWDLRCSPNGRCLAAGPSGVAYSTDDGLDWSLSSGWPTEAASYFSCATAARCTALSLPPGASAESLFVSNDGGESWSGLKARGLPTGVLFTGLACPTSSGCWLSGNKQGGQLSGRAGVVLSSANGGRTWGASLLPHGAGSVFAVSCPDQGTCFALAAKQPQASSFATAPVLVLLAHFGQGNHSAAP